MARVRGVAAGLSVVTAFWMGASCNTADTMESSTTATRGNATGAAPSRLGANCSSSDDCDDTTYCHADDENCGPGKCRERPRRSLAPATAVFCGCDGQLYNGMIHPRFKGIDVGNNDRCAEKPGIAWRCGPRIVCGSAPCKDPDAGSCNDWPCSAIPQPYEVCAHSEFGYECVFFGFELTSCQDPHILDVCNSCYTEPCDPGDNTHRFSSFTCSMDSCGGTSIECIK